MGAGRIGTTGLCCLAGLLGSVSAAGAQTVQAGVGRADITPPPGFYMQGWVRSDDLAAGTLTRLYARAIVLQEGARKVALVAEDVNGIPGGMLDDAARKVGDLGFSEQNVLDTASHTHAAPTGFYNFSTYNTVLPTPDTPTKLSVAFSPQLYSFEVNQLAMAIRRANADLGPARIGWGHTTLLGLTQNRSLEAHLANFAINEPPGSGTVDQDPGGYADTIDPNVDVLRVDKLLSVSDAGAGPCAASAGHRRCHRARAASTARTAATAARVRGRKSPRPTKHTTGTTERWVPVGMWSTFANHGTVIKSDFPYYNGDHQASAMRMVESEIRSSGGAPAGQDVVDVFGNSDAGDVTAGIRYSGPAEADYVGHREGAAFLDAWRQAGASMSEDPALGMSWTRVCFCGQQVDNLGQVASSAAFGLPQITGSEEGRGGLYQLTHVATEGYRLPVSVGPQGDKIIDVPDSGNGFPKAVPLAAVRIGDRMLVSEPGEPTAEAGRRLRAAVLSATSAAGIHEVVVAGYANEYVDYFTTPEEYDAQHYEGGSTVYGRLSSVLLQDSDVALARSLVDGQPAPPAYAYDDVNGVAMDNTPFPTGAASAAVVSQPTATARLDRAVFSWQGSVGGYDRPLDAAFVTVREQTPSGWQAVGDDLGISILWSVDDKGVYTARWQIDPQQPTGTYDFLVTANHYTRASAPFSVTPASSIALAPAPAGGSEAAVSLSYPPLTYNVDLTDRAAQPTGGSVRFIVDGTPVLVRQSTGAVFTVPAGANSSVTIPPGAAQDPYGNSNAQGITLQPPPPAPNPANGGRP